MHHNILCFVILVNFLFLSVSPGTANELQRHFVEELLIAEGLAPLQAKSIIFDRRITIRPDIVIKNLFYSKPQGTAQRPAIMDIDTRQIERGKAFIKKNAEILNTVEKRFGTSPRIITSLLIIESRLGTYPMPYNVVNAYANLAFILEPKYFKEVQNHYGSTYPQFYDEATIARAKRKATWAVVELYHLVQIANHLKIDPLTISGSFAGAMGPAQFIPSSFWIFGIDGDDDGIANPFSMADANFSMGHYLKKYGWREDASLEQKRKAIWYYNHSDIYVNTVMMIYDELGQ
jgi:membrane-bound lytic murein transglycosylase B